MSDPWDPGQPPPPPYGQVPPPYGAPPGYWNAPVPYGAPPGAYGGGWWGPPGRIRPTGKSIALFICTLGIYMYVYNYKVHSEMKDHSGRGIGGGIALLLSFLANVAMPFVTPAEVGSLYARRGQTEPVNGWTGLWVLIPAIGGYIVLFVILISTFATTTNADGSTTTAGGVGIGIGFVIYFGCVIAGGLAWFVKTNGALNRYWESVGVLPSP